MSDSVRKVVQCSGHTKAGRRCARRTSKTNLCYQHLNSELHLKIKPSHIKAAGLGLYTTIPRKKDANVAKYSGEKVISHDPNYGGDYVLQIRNIPPTFINANATTSGPGRYSNNARRGQHELPGVRNNANLRLNVRAGTADIKATHAIAANHEVYTAYGGTYWNKKAAAEREHARAQARAANH